MGCRYHLIATSSDKDTIKSEEESVKKDKERANVCGHHLQKPFPFWGLSCCLQCLICNKTDGLEIMLRGYICSSLHCGTIHCNTLASLFLDNYHPLGPLSNWKVNQPPAHLQLSSRGLQLTRSPVPAEEKHLCNIMVPPLCFTVDLERMCAL
ncbi:hypothetical protein UPYG_G00280760 [Umbra pygmaea]|uniref:Uncharacterized protein n=1 Tax=Umbra pygmaea TaxID=75934 RepID=A0ABD0WRZ4_UMBPY